MDETRCANGKSGTEGEVGSWEKARRISRRLGRVTLGPGIGISRAAEGWRVMSEGRPSKRESVTHVSFDELSGRKRLCGGCYNNQKRRRGDWT